MTLRSTAKAGVATSEERAGTAAERATELRRTAEASIAKADFPSLADAKAAVIAQAQVPGLRKRVDQYRVDREATERRIAALNEELGGVTVSAAEVEEARTAYAAGQQAHTAAVDSVATLRTQIGITRSRVDRRAELAAEHEKFAAEHGVFRSELADGLRTDRFQEFVLEESFQDLAHGASQRLGELTGRYALTYEDGNILVVDHDNADETRSADTLSGGETFLASLALALELSEQIQQAAGAVSLESLFIDEGFGSLDEGALDGAASAVESLEGGGRMVGIITHIRELADRLPCRIVVERRDEGSRVQVQVG